MADFPRMNSKQAKAQAEAVFRSSSPPARISATEEDRAQQQATLDNIARLRALRLARQSQALLNGAEERRGEPGVPQVCERVGADVQSRHPRPQQKGRQG